MSEALNKENKENQNNKNKLNLKLSFITILSLIIAGYFTFKYFFPPITAKATKKISNSINIPISNEKNTNHTTVNDEKNDNSHFIYQTLLENQQQISKLKEQLAELEAKLAKNSNQKRVGRLILLYTKLRNDIFNGQFDKLTAQNIKILSDFDQKLQENFKKLQNLLPNLKNRQNLIESFSNLIPKLIIAKNHEPKGNFLTKIRENITNLVIIRRIDGKNDEEIDNKIANIEKLLTKANYQTALEELDKLETKYQALVADFKQNLEIALEVQKIDREILTYLQNMT